MARTVFLGALLMAIGALAAHLVGSLRAPTEPVRSEAPSPPQPVVVRERSIMWERADDDRYRADLERRLQVLEARLAEETAERQRLEAQLAALGRGAEEPATASAIPNAPPAPAEAPQSDATTASAVDESKSATERALTAAGLDAAAAEDIKRRHDWLVMAEISLRDQATREGWMDSPRFAEEMAALNAQRTSIRDEIGDDAYDRYLFALGRPNRVRIDDVLIQSPAEQVGLRTGDMIIRYGGTRIFAPEELVAETHGGTLGDMVRVEVIRSGERLEVEVPRGLLGIRVGATQDMPESS